MSSLSSADVCPKCGTDLTDKDGYSRVIYRQYPAGHPECATGTSEYQCPDCYYREGRWSGRELKDGEFEPRYGGYRSKSEYKRVTTLKGGVPNE